MKNRLIYIIGIFLLLLSPVLSHAQISYQYWIDNDTGSTVSGTTTDGTAINMNIDAATLTPGVHFYNIRARESKKWGPVHRALFCIPRDGQESAARLITGYQYDFGGEVTTVAITPATEYTLNTSFDVPEPPLPTVIDDDCHFAFMDDEATLLRNISMSFSLVFRDEANAMASPVGTSFTVTDTRTTEIVTLEVPGQSILAAHASGGYNVLQFTIPQTAAYIFESSAAAMLRLYGEDGAFITTIDAETLAAAAPRDLDAGSYYVVAYGNAEEATLTLRPQRIVKNIEFVDAKVKELCIGNWDANGDGELDEDEAAAVTSLDKVFSNNSEITSFNELQYFTGLTSISDNAFMVCEKLTAITIPATVTAIGNNAFLSTGLTAITLPEGLLTIGHHAFSDTHLESLSIPASVNSIGASCFYLTPQLRSIVVDETNTVYDSRNNCNAIIETASNTLLRGCSTTVIPDDVVAIGDSAFHSCVNLQAIDFPGSVTKIGQDAFYGTGLKTVRIPKSIVSIGETAFVGGTQLESISVDEENDVYDSRGDCNALIETATNKLLTGCKITVIPGDVVAIGLMAFRNNIGLTSVDIPESVTSVSTLSFDGCTGLSKVTLHNTNPETLKGNGGTTDPFPTRSDITLYVPYGTKTAYEAYDYWKEFKEILELAKVCGYAIFDDATGTLTFKYGEMPVGDNVWETENLIIENYNLAPWSPNVKKVVFEESYAMARPTSTAWWFSKNPELAEFIGMENLNTSEVTNMRAMFGWSGLTNIDLRYFDTQKVTNMCEMFAGCDITDIDLSCFDTRNVTTMASMFYGCKNLTRLDLSSFRTESLTNMYQMFMNCKLQSLDISNFNTSHVEQMKYLFYNCSNLENLDLSHFDTSNVKEMTGMFKGCTNLKSLNIKNFVTNKVTDMGYMFSGCNSLTVLDLSNFDTSLVENMGPDNSIRNGGGMFQDCNSLTSLNVSSFDTKNVRNMGQMFKGCSALTSLDLRNFDTSNVTDMTYMFNDCSSLTSLDLSNFDTQNVKNMTGMFNLCYKLKTLNISSFNTSKVTAMSGMFNSCNELTSLDLSHFNTSNVTSMASMFNFCCSLTNLDLSNFDTSNVTAMWGMFQYCSSLTSLDLSHFNTQKVTSMQGMFGNCYKLQNLDLSNFNTENVTNMSQMFQCCVALTNLDLSHFNTGKVTAMKGMFNECGRLENLNVGSFNTSKVTDMTLMFAKTNSLTKLDLSCFDTGNVTAMDSLFCSTGPSRTRYWWSSTLGRSLPEQQWSNVSGTKLKTVYVSEAWNTTNVENGHYMFGGCTALVGGEGTTYSPTNTDKTYARIDGGTSAPGYFTDKAAAQPLAGDVNGDGVVDVADAMAVINYMLEKPSGITSKEAADLNGDGKVDVSDVVKVISLTTTVTP